MEYLLDRAQALSRLVAGDLIYGERVAGTVLICLVTAMTDTTIEARRITTQDPISFDLVTGDEQGGDGRITSIEPLPLDVHATLMRLERRMRLAVILQVPALEPAERQALLAISEFYAAYPLPAIKEDTKRT